MTGGPCVLVVEDEASFADALTVGLEREGFVVDVATDGVAALDVFDADRHELVLLDLMLPRLSGIDVCKQLRARSAVPIIMLTARHAEVDAVVGLEIGADDYITKPYRLRELVARMRAVLRRATTPSDGIEADAADGGTIEVGSVRLDAERREVTVDGEPVTFPRKEFELLEALMARAGRVATRDALIADVWGADYVGDTRTLDAHVKRLRAKIEADPAQPARITTIRGVGYRYEGRQR